MMELIHKSNSRMYFPQNQVLAMLVSNLILQIWNNCPFFKVCMFCQCQHKYNSHRYLKRVTQLVGGGKNLFFNCYHALWKSLNCSEASFSLVLNSPPLITQTSVVLSFSTLIGYNSTTLARTKTSRDHGDLEEYVKRSNGNALGYNLTRH